MLASLHWLPACLRIDFKILMITMKALDDLAPTYLLDLLTPSEPLRNLRFSGWGLLSFPVSSVRTNSVQS